MKNIRGFSLIELLITLSIVGIVIGSTGGIMTRMLLNGNSIKANLAEVDLKTDICRSLNHFESCKDHFQEPFPTITRLLLRSGKTLEADYIYNKFLKIVKLERIHSSDPDVTEILKIYYKKLNVSFDTSDSCTSTNVAKCETQSYDIAYNFTDQNNEICYPIYCGNNADSPDSTYVETRHKCPPDNISGCTLESAFSGVIRIGQCTGVENKGYCKYECRDDGWHEVSDACRLPYDCTNIEKDDCPLPNEIHGGVYDGNCTAGLTGTCKYTCNDGEWKKENNNCREVINKSFKKPGKSNK